MRISRWTIVFACLTIFFPQGQGSLSAYDPTITPEQLVRMTRAELECQYRNGRFAPWPTGFSKGRPIWTPGSRLAMPAARLTRPLWQGKINRGDGTMVNRILGLRLFDAEVSVGPSWLDGGISQIMDYGPTTKLFADVRDEAREVSPGVFLCITYLRKCPQPKLAMFFVLDARKNLPVVTTCQP